MADKPKGTEVIPQGDNTAPSNVDSPATFAPDASKVPPQPVFEEG